MKRTKEVLMYGTSEGRGYFATSVATAENHFGKKTENFNAVFCGEKMMVENDYGFYVDGNCVEKVGRGVYRYV